MEEKEEQKIIEQCKNGNFDGFDGFYGEYLEKIYRFIYYRTRHKETAEDLASRTFIKAFENIKKFDPKKGSFSAWIYCIARNNMIDHYRSKKDAVDIADFWGFGLDENIGQRFDNKEKLKEVGEYLKLLDKIQREVVIMRVWDNLSYREISQVIGKNEAHCKVIFSRAINKLREKILPILFLILLVS